MQSFRNHTFLWHEEIWMWYLWCHVRLSRSKRSNAMSTNSVTWNLKIGSDNCRSEKCLQGFTGGNNFQKEFVLRLLYNHRPRSTIFVRNIAFRLKLKLQNIFYSTLALQAEASLTGLKKASTDIDSGSLYKWRHRFSLPDSRKWRAVPGFRGFERTLMEFETRARQTFSQLSEIMDPPSKIASLIRGRERKTCVSSRGVGACWN